MTIIGVDIDAAVQPVITLFDGSNSTGSGVSVTLHVCLLAGADLLGYELVLILICISYTTALRCI